MNQPLINQSLTIINMIFIIIILFIYLLFGGKIYSDFSVCIQMSKFVFTFSWNLNNLNNLSDRII